MTQEHGRIGSACWKMAIITNRGTKETRSNASPLLCLKEKQNRYGDTGFIPLTNIVNIAKIESKN